MSGRLPAALFQGRARVRTCTTKVIILRNIAAARTFIARVIRAGNWPVKLKSASFEAGKLDFEGRDGVFRRLPRPILHLIAKPGELALGIAARIHDGARLGFLQ